MEQWEFINDLKKMFKGKIKYDIGRPPVPLFDMEPIKIPPMISDYCWDTSRYILTIKEEESNGNSKAR